MVEGIEAMFATVLGVKTRLAFAKLLTLYEPPAQVHVVCHATVVPLAESRPVHWEPEVAALEPQRLL